MTGEGGGQINTPPQMSEGGGGGEDSVLPDQAPAALELPKQARQDFRGGANGRGQLLFVDLRRDLFLLTVPLAQEGAQALLDVLTGQLPGFLRQITLFAKQHGDLWRRPYPVPSPALCSGFERKKIRPFPFTSLFFISLSKCMCFTEETPSRQTALSVR